MYQGEPIRLVGVRVDDLETEEELQMSLFSVDEKQNNLDKALDKIMNKYGTGAITRAGKLNINLQYKKEKNEK